MGFVDWPGRPTWAAPSGGLLPAERGGFTVRPRPRDHVHRQMLEYSPRHGAAARARAKSPRNRMGCHPHDGGLPRPSG